MSHFNIAILPKRYRREVAEQRTAESLTGIKAVLEKLSSSDKFSVESEDAEEGVKSLRKALLGYRATPITRHWRLIWSQDDDTKAIQHGWAKRIGKIRGHQAAWGFRRGRSCHDCCEAHLTYWGIQRPGELSFLSMDVENFFPSITDKMIGQAMEKHGFDEQEISDCVDICTFELNCGTLWDRLIERLAESTGGQGHQSGRAGVVTLRDMFGSPTGRTGLFNFVSSVLRTGRYGGTLFHPDAQRLIKELIFRYICGFGRDTNMGDRLMIQGSPASPALSNLVAKRIDYRLDAMARARGAFYSRYADDVTFSWKTRHGKKWIGLLTYSATKILEEHGLYIRPDKTIIKGPGMRQSMLGYNLNSGSVTVSRARRHRVQHTLKKMSSGELDPDGSNLESLMGEVEFIATAHPEVAKTLRALGKEAMARAGTSGRVCLHFDDHNVGPVDHEHEPRPMHMW